MRTASVVLPHRLLIADDDDRSRRLLQATLGADGIAAEMTADGAEVWAAMEQDRPPSLLLLDWSMPGLGGPDICRKVRARVNVPYTYILIVSARCEGSDVAFALDSGADDYVKKPFHGPELVQRVKSGMRILDLQASLHAAQEELRLLATHDALTGLLNRGAITESLDAELERARREGVPLTVALVDLDHFKQINDTLGHLAGDEVLRAVSATMAHEVRRYDLVGRYGGEEFMVLIPGCDARSGGHVAERIRRAVTKRPVGTLDPLAISVSIGVAEARADLNARALIHQADLALYRAKRNGRNRVEVAGEEPETSDSRSDPGAAR